ncbi:transporter [Jeongeupia sp. HS-3]|uniref:ABC transporter permease n=1 Tax=Jeongeupia sp. HS-3 TaxID=1009682 RepID=UPI0018A3D33B|nr:ABC-2 family transporter protein [Jeongeupia sp. HS-3]BCL74735.1 transporter [Jeongeupia sp. HS-3]
MRDGLSVYLTLARGAIAARITDRTDLVLSMVIMLLADLVVPLTTIIVYRHGAGFAGWSQNEALLLQASFLLAKGIAFPLCFGMIWTATEHVREGTLDMLLLKPRSTLLLLMGYSFEIEDLGKLAGGAVLFGYALSQLGPASVHPAPFLLLLALAVATLFGFALVMTCLSFVWVGNSRLHEIFDAVSAFALYPHGIFSRSALGWLTWVIPVSVLGYLPASALLGRLDAAWPLALACSALFIIAALTLWRATLARYSSAGG